MSQTTLEWQIPAEPQNPDDTILAFADCRAGSYTILAGRCPIGRNPDPRFAINVDGVWYWKPTLYGPRGRSIECDSLEDAKARAQADSEWRL